MSPIRRFFRRLFFFGAPLLLLLVGVIVFSMHGVFGPVDPDAVDRTTLIRLMQLRDFRRLPPELQARMTDRVEAEFGRQSPRPPVFDFSALDKKVYAHFQQHRAASPPLFQTNLTLMARIRYFQWMNDFESASVPDRETLMRDVLLDLDYWQVVYMNFLHAAELPIPSLAELIREFDEMIEGFKVGADGADVARIDAFRVGIQQAYAAREMRGAVKNLTDFTDRVTSAASNIFGSLLVPPKKKEEEKVESGERIVESGEK